MWSKVTPLLLTVSPKSHYTGRMGSSVSTFHTLCNPYNLSPKSIYFSSLVLGQQHNRWTLKLPVLHTHFGHCRTYYRETNKATIRFLHTSEREGEFLEILYKLDTLCRQHWETTIRSRCASTPVSLSVYWTAALVFWGSLSIRALKETVHS